MSRSHAVRRIVGGVLLAAGIVVFAAASASAHAELVETTPSSGTLLASEPTEVTLTFSETVNVALGRVAVLGPDGQTAQVGKAENVDGGRVLVRLRRGLPIGTYLLSYRVVSADGHPIAGGFSFSIGERSAAAVPGGAQDAAAAVDPLVRVLLSVGKYAGYAGVVLLGGALVMAAAFWPSRLALDGPRRWARRGWILLFAGTIVAVLAQVPYATGTTITAVTWEQATATAATTVGLAHLVRLVVLFVAAPLIWQVTRTGVVDRFTRILAWFWGALLCLTWPLAGHAGSGPWWQIAVLLGAVHVGAVSIWVGGLVVLARSLLPVAHPRELTAILPVWSRWALWSVAAVTASGIVQTGLQLGSVGALTGTTYGRLIVAKTVGLAVLMALAWSARRIVRRLVPAPDSLSRSAEVVPEEQGSERDRPRLRQLRYGVLAEIAVAGAVIAVATALVQTTPGYSAAATSDSASGTAERPVGTPFYSIDRTPTLTLQIDVDPAQVGSNNMLLTVLDPDNKPLKALEWTVTASLPARGLRNVQIPVSPFADSVAAAFPQLPVPGDWSFTVTVRISEIDQVVVTRVVRIY